MTFTFDTFLTVIHSIKCILHCDPFCTCIGKYWFRYDLFQLYGSSLLLPPFIKKKRMSSPNPLH